jgi:hypothetical protein
MFAMLRGIPAYNVEDVIRHLRAVGALSEAARVLGAGLSNDDASTEHAAIAARFWHYVLHNKPSPDMVTGFGWCAEITVLHDAAWADLTRRTLSLTHGRIDHARRVAERAARANPSADSIDILNQLVRGGGDSWEQHSILDTASAAITRARYPLTRSSEYGRLRTALLERGKTVPLPRVADSDEVPELVSEDEPGDSAELKQ